MPGVTTAYQSGVHGSRPAASAGCILYACSTHSLIYRSDGSTWTTWMTIGSSTTTVASDAIWDAAGDLAQGTGADAAAKLSAGATGKVLQAAGAAVAVAWKYPPGYELDYVEFSSGVAVSATTEATANTVVTSNAITYDGSTIVEIEFACGAVNPVTGGSLLRAWLYEKVGAAAAASIGQLGLWRLDQATSPYSPFILRRRMTPTAASIIYSVRGSVSSGTANFAADPGGAGNQFPGSLRITKVSGGA